jgi:hypothetical protein
MNWFGPRPPIAAKASMTFPNQSRSYDPTRRAVRFWGYDRSMESSFFVACDALRHMQPDLQPDEAGYLQAFDRNRKFIHEIAARTYSRGRKNIYDLVVADFS